MQVKLGFIHIQLISNIKLGVKLLWLYDVSGLSLELLWGSAVGNVWAGEGVGWWILEASVDLGFGDVGNIGVARGVASGTVSGCGDVSDRNVCFDWFEVDSLGSIKCWSRLSD